MTNNDIIEINEDIEVDKSKLSSYCVKDQFKAYQTEKEKTEIKVNTAISRALLQCLGNKTTIKSNGKSFVYKTDLFDTLNQPYNNSYNGNSSNEQKNCFYFLTEAFNFPSYLRANNGHPQMLQYYIQKYCNAFLNNFAKLSLPKQWEVLRAMINLEADNLLFPIPDRNSKNIIFDKYCNPIYTDLVGLMVVDTPSIYNYNVRNRRFCSPFEGQQNLHIQNVSVLPILINAVQFFCGPGVDINTLIVNKINEKQQYLIKNIQNGTFANKLSEELKNLNIDKNSVLWQNQKENIIGEQINKLSNNMSQYYNYRSMSFQGNLANNYYTLANLSKSFPIQNILNNLTDKIDEVNEINNIKPFMDIYNDNSETQENSIKIKPNYENSLDEEMSKIENETKNTAIDDKNTQQNKTTNQENLILQKNNDLNSLDIKSIQKQKGEELDSSEISIDFIKNIIEESNNKKKNKEIENLVLSKNENTSLGTLIKEINSNSKSINDDSEFDQQSNDKYVQNNTNTITEKKRLSMMMNKSDLNNTNQTSIISQYDKSRQNINNNTSRIHNNNRNNCLNYN